MLQIGDQFDRFIIRSFIAQGGMADIYHAHDLMSGKDVVLKIPNRMFIGDPAQYERFQRELEVSNTLSHPAIQRGLGSGQYNRTPYLITEFVTGGSMRQMIEQKAPLPVEEAIVLIRKIADAAGYIHENGVIHRDLKPENVIISSEGQPVILDFGLALTKGSRRVTYASLTPTAGTPDYMAPEQIDGQRGDARTDIYALGVIFYELLTGHVPFGEGGDTAVITQRMRGAIPRLDQERSEVSPQVAAVIARCLQREPADRYPNAAALIHDLDHLDEVDITILDKVPAERSTFWHSDLFYGLMIALVVIVVIVVLALAGQGAAR